MDRINFAFTKQGKMIHNLNEIPRDTNLVLVSESSKFQGINFHHNHPTFFNTKMASTANNSRMVFSRQETRMSKSFVAKDFYDLEDVAKEKAE